MKTTARLVLMFGEPSGQPPHTTAGRERPLRGATVVFDNDAIPLRFRNEPVVGVTVASAVGATQAFARAAVMNKVLLDPETEWMGDFLPTE